MRIAPLLITIGSLALVGCASGVSGARQAGDPPIGADCRLQFKRSDLGAADKRPISPTAIDSDVSVSGKLLRIDQDWVVLDTAGTNVQNAAPSKVWVPMRNVLLLQFR
jgi:hypothetical protein